MLHLDEGDEGRLVQLPLGEELALSLPEQASTGFRWSLARGGDGPLRLTDEQRHPAPLAPGGAPRLGAAGAHVWILRAVSSGRAGLLFVYTRPFLPEQTPARSFHLEVEVPR